MNFKDEHSAIFVFLCILFFCLVCERCNHHLIFDLFFFVYQNFMLKEKKVVTTLKYIYIKILWKWKIIMDPDLRNVSYLINHQLEFVASSMHLKSFSKTLFTRNLFHSEGIIESCNSKEKKKTLSFYRPELDKLLKKNRNEIQNPHKFNYILKN